MLPELDAARGFSSRTLDPMARAAMVVLGGLYAAGVVRRVRSGQRWSVTGTLAFALLGLGMLVVATMSSLAGPAKERSHADVGEEVIAAAVTSLPAETSFTSRSISGA